MENRVSETLPAANLTAVLTAAETIRTNLPGLMSLTDEQRRNMLKIGQKNIVFADHALEVSTQNPQLLPAIFEVSEWQKDADYFQALGKILVALLPLVNEIQDTQMLAGSEHYASALAAYQYLKNTAVGGDLGEVMDDLGQRFAHKMRHTPPATSPGA